MTIEEIRKQADNLRCITKDAKAKYLAPSLIGWMLRIIEQDTLQNGWRECHCFGINPDGYLTPTGFNFYCPNDEDLSNEDEQVLMSVLAGTINSFDGYSARYYKNQSLGDVLEIKIN